MRFNRQGAFLTALMLAGLLAALTGVVRRFVPAWQPGYIVAAGVLVALEACAVHHIFRRDRMWFGELGRYLLPELLVMAALMRVATTLSLGLGTLFDDVRRWVYDPLSIFDLPFICALFAGVVIGYLAHVSMQDLFELAPRSFDTPEALRSDNQRAIVVAAEDRSIALRRISSRFVIGGVLVIVALGLEAVNIERIAGQGRPVALLSAAGALLYLVCGLLLYSQGRLALLRARWLLDGAQIAPSVTRRWVSISWLLVGGIALLALLLPRTYGLGLLDTFRTVLGVLGYVIAIIGYAVIWLFGLLALLPAWLLSLLATSDTAPPPPPPTFTPPPPPPPTVEYQPQLLATIVFWVCMLLLVTYAAWTVVQRHPGVAQAVTHRGPLAWLLRRFAWLWRDTRTWAAQVSQVVQQRLSRPPRSQPAQRRWVWLRRLPPRELVRYFYRSTLRRAAQAGLPRRPNQTPNEYQAQLARHLPDAQYDIAELTQAFVVAEYSPQAVESDDAQRARRPWQRLRRRLRAMFVNRSEVDDVDE